MAATSLLMPLYAWRFRGVDAIVGCNQPSAWIAWWAARLIDVPYVVYLNQPNRLVYPRNIDRADRLGRQRRLPPARGDRAARDAVRGLGRPALGAGGGPAAGQRRLHRRHHPRHLQPRGRRLPGRLPRRRVGLSAARSTTRFSGGLTINGYPDPAALRAADEPALPAEAVRPGDPRDGRGAQAASARAARGPGPGDVAHRRAAGAGRPSSGWRTRCSSSARSPKTSCRRLYEGAAVYVYPAPEEDFGMGVIESMAKGVPVVAWNQAGPDRHGRAGHRPSRRAARGRATTRRASRACSTIRPPTRPPASAPSHGRGDSTGRGTSTRSSGRCSRSRASHERVALEAATA